MEDGPPIFKQGFSCPALLISHKKTFRVPGYHRLWRNFPAASTNPSCALRLFPVRSPLLRESLLISFPLGTEMFQFPRFASSDLCIQSGMFQKTDDRSKNTSSYLYLLSTAFWTGFPIRTSSDYRSFASSPKLFAGYHVLLRLLLPRHPPCALTSLTL